MVKEYISKLQTENEEKILQLKKEGEELEKELSSAQKIKNSLMSEKQSDAGIFSPRAKDLNSEEKIKEAEDNICQLQQQIDNLALQKKDAMKNSEEFRLLQAELNQTEDKKEDNTENNSTVSKEFLQVLYKKIEASLSLLNGNKNRCRSELRSALNMIRQFENQSDS